MCVRYEPVDIRPQGDWLCQRCGNRCYGGDPACKKCLAELVKRISDGEDPGFKIPDVMQGAA